MRVIRDPDDRDDDAPDRTMGARDPFVRAVAKALAAIGSDLDPARLALSDMTYGVDVEISGMDVLWRSRTYLDTNRPGPTTSTTDRRRAAADVASELDAIHRHRTVIAEMHECHMERARREEVEIVEHGVSYVNVVTDSHGSMVDRVQSKLHAVMIGDGYAPELREYDMGSTGWGGLSAHARTHRRRRDAIATGDDGLLVEDRLARLLAEMDEVDLSSIERLLRADPKGPECGGGVWSRDRLAKEGVELPTGIETLSVTDGMVHGRIRLSGRTTWNRGRLLHAGTTLPETIIDALPGRALRTLVEHPMLDGDAVIQGIRMDGRGEVRARVDVRTMPYAGIAGLRRPGADGDPSPPPSLRP